MDDRTPPGERDVFGMLADGPDDWVVLHSLDLAPWNRDLRTEIDFVVVIPRAGILCIEVKSHTSISFDGAWWYPESITRSPFKQAADGRFAFSRRLAELVPELKKVPVGHCCVFPRSVFQLPRNLSVLECELIDAARLRALGGSDGFCKDLEQKLLEGVDAEQRTRRLGSPLSRAQVEEIVRCCVPIQRRRPDLREEMDRRAAEAERVLREQQRPVLQLTELNPRVIVSGPAGTGKTLIAKEIAQRAARQGKRVAFLCFNQLVGDWLAKQCSEGGRSLPNLVVGRAVKTMARLAGVEIPEAAPAAYWDTEFPSALEGALTDPDLKDVAGFDYLVLDEAQDLLARPKLWECLQLFLKGGVADGHWTICGDFHHQVLSGSESVQANLEVLHAKAQPVRWRLSENCRNYRIVGETATGLAGMGAGVYAGFMRSGGSVRNYDIKFYESDDDQLQILKSWIQEFTAQGYERSDIVLLSFREDAASAAGRLEAQGVRVHPAWREGRGTAYSSVHSFKGLERKIVILTDVVLKGGDASRHLFYAGLTRATESARVLCQSDSKAVLGRWMSGAETQ